MLVKQYGFIAKRSDILKANHIPSANTAAVVTLAATTNRQHVVHGVQWSYSVDPTGGKLTITVNGSTVWEVDVTSSGPGGFSCEIPGGTNQAIVVTLAAGGGASVAKINVQYTSESPSSQ